MQYKRMHVHKAQPHIHTYIRTPFRKIKCSLQRNMLPKDAVFQYSVDMHLCDTPNFQTLVVVIGFKSGTIIATCTCLYLTTRLQTIQLLNSILYSVAALSIYDEEQAQQKDSDREGEREDRERDRVGTQQKYWLHTHAHTNIHTLQYVKKR